MEQLNVPLKEFNLTRFINKIIDFNKTVISNEFDASYIIAEVPKVGGVPKYKTGSKDYNFKSKLIEEGKRLFFPFSATNVGEEIPCADGKTYEIDDEGESDLCFGEADCIGYLVEIKDGKVIINTAVNYGGACVAPPASVEIQKECDIFEEPMRKFLGRFIRKG